MLSAQSMIHSVVGLNLLFNVHTKKYYRRFFNYILISVILKHCYKKELIASLCFFGLRFINLVSQQVHEVIFVSPGETTNYRESNTNELNTNFGFTCLTYDWLYPLRYCFWFALDLVLDWTLYSRMVKNWPDAAMHWLLRPLAWNLNSLI